MVRVALAVLMGLPMQLSAGAWSSGRPPECADPAGRSANAWERAKAPELRRHCDLLASASSKLAGISAMAHGALDAAREADRVLPGYAAPRALEGRALAALGQFSEALVALAESKSLDPRSLDEPLALLSWARSLARTGHLDVAAEAYRALLPRATALPGGDRARAEVEAGLVAMQRGPAGLDEAAGALRDALREAQNEAHAVAVLALALALDRRGDAQEGRALLVERVHGDPRDAIGSSRAKEILAVAPDETHALAAIGLESTRMPEAREEWQRALAAAPAGPWAAHARAHLSAIGAALGGKRRVAGASP